MWSTHPIARVGNNRRVEKWSSRHAHNVKIGGSIPSPAIMIIDINAYQFECRCPKCQSELRATALDFPSPRVAGFAAAIVTGPPHVAKCLVCAAKGYDTEVTFTQIKKLE